MVTEFDGYSLSGSFICVCGVVIAVIGINSVHRFTCDACDRRFVIARPVIQLMDREDRDE